MKIDLRQRLLATTLFAGVALIAQPALAQNQVENPSSPDETREAEDVQMEPGAAVEDSQTEEGDEIVVTGTLIRNPNIESSAPVTTIGEAEVELQQVNVAEDLLREIPGVVPSIGSQTNNGNGGQSFVNLRGLGINRNLVLLDGKRIVPGNLTGVVDLNNIPVALIERTDILTGGASTTYGADAVSGVVNFITKRDFAGIDIGLSEQITEEGDGNVFRADITMGANFDDGRGNATFSVGYQEADPVYQGSRDFSAVSLSSVSGIAQGSGTSVPSRFFIPGTGFRQVNPTSATGFNPTGAFQSFNFNPFNIFQTPFERFNLFGQANYEIFDGIELYTSGLFSKQTVSTIVAPSGSFGTNIAFGLDNPFLSAAQRETFRLAFDTDPGVDSTGPGIDDDLVTPGIQNNVVDVITPPTAAQVAANPGAFTFDTPVTRRFTEGGSRLSDFTTQVFNYELGMRGDVTENIGFDVFGSYGESENTQRQRNNGLLSRLRQAADATTDATGAPVCRDTSNNCIPLNLFGPEGSVSQEAFGFINVSTTASTIVQLAQARGVLSGDLDFISLRSPLADEAFGFAIGAEYRDYTARTTSDISQQTPDEVLGNGAAAPDSVGSYDVYEGFAEIIAPLIVDRPFFHSLQLELGGRVSDYSSSGVSYTYKVAGQWEPVSSLKFRGGYNRATRSPNIGELFAPSVTGLDNLGVDPCQGTLPLRNANLRAVCLAQGAPAARLGLIDEPSAGQINVTGGGNPNLDVEKADTYTAGVVFQPDFVPGLSLSVDYYDISVEDAITAPTSGDVLRACFGASTFSDVNPVDPGAGAATNPACTSIRRNAVTGGLDGAASLAPGLPLNLSNLGGLETSGVDLIAAYRRDLGFANLNLSFNGNWTRESVFQATPDGEAVDCVGRFGVECGSLQPEFSFLQRTTLGLGGTDISLLWRFVDDMRVLSGGFRPEFSSIDEKHYFDLSLRQEVTDDINFVFSVFNLFDNQPPVVGNTIGSTTFNSGNTFPSTYDPLGRRFAIGANLRF